jgi:hypothetical protein
LGDNEKRALTALNRYQIERGLLNSILPLDDLIEFRSEPKTSLLILLPPTLGDIERLHQY